MMLKERIPKARCAICQTMQKNSRYWLCRECAVEWGCYRVPYKQWPEWVKGLVKETQRQRKQEERATMRLELKTPQEMEEIIDNISAI